MRIETLDLEFQGTPGVIASYLTSGSDGAVLIETGPGSTLDTLTALLAEHGVTPADVRHVLLTHIHLDHAGAAGWWARQGATVYVHELGAPHLIDPSRLLASAQRIYGDLMGPLWGEMVPAPAERVVVVRDGDVIDAGGLGIRALETPGHARHHHVYRLEGVAFTGDAAGIRLPLAPWVDLPAPPPEFDLEAWKATLERLRGEAFERIYPTHFGANDDVERQLAALESTLDASTAKVRELLAADLEREALIARFTDWVRADAGRFGIDAELFHAYDTANPRAMSVDGIARYWRKRAAR